MTCEYNHLTGSPPSGPIKTSEVLMSRKEVPSLIGSMRIVEEAIASLITVEDKFKVPEAVVRKFAGSGGGLDATFLWLIDGEESFNFGRTSLSDERLKEVQRKITSLWNEGFLANLEQATLVIGYEERKAILTPLRHNEQTVGILVIGAPQIAKDFIPSIETLSTAISLSWQECDKWTERRRKEEALTEMAYYDKLTGLPNRRLFNDRLGQELSSAWRNQEELAVMVLDLDHFKNVNDTLGHDGGDKLLQAVAERLASLLRKSDTVARWGGDEFTLFLPKVVSEQDATKVAEKILEALEKPFIFNGHTVDINTSIGISLYPHNGENDDVLMAHADIAMYNAKDQGRNKFIFFQEGMTIPRSQADR